MTLLRISRKLHKWLMLLVGLQFLIWSVSGAYMVILDIDYIHGDTLVNQSPTPINTSQVKVTFQQVLRQYPEAKNISLSMLQQQAVYLFDHHGETQRLSATTGKLLAPITQAQAISIAKLTYSGQGEIKGVQLITEDTEQAPNELSRRVLPAWQVHFDDFASPTLYVSKNSGQVVTKRHSFWRIFDWMFKFHIMDYQDSEVDNNLLFFTALIGVFSALAGLVLVYFSVLRRSNGAAS